MLSNKEHKEELEKISKKDIKRFFKKLGEIKTNKDIDELIKDKTNIPLMKKFGKKPFCHKCGKYFEKVNDYEYKPICEHLGKGRLRMFIG